MSSHCSRWCRDLRTRRSSICLISKSGLRLLGSGITVEGEEKGGIVGSDADPIVDGRDGDDEERGGKAGKEDEATAEGRDRDGDDEETGGADGKEEGGSVERRSGGEEEVGGNPGRDDGASVKGRSGGDEEAGENAGNDDATGILEARGAGEARVGPDEAVVAACEDEDANLTPRAALGRRDGDDEDLRMPLVEDMGAGAAWDEVDAITVSSAAAAALSAMMRAVVASPLAMPLFTKSRHSSAVIGLLCA